MEVDIKKITSVDKPKTRIHHRLTFYFDDESLQTYEINKKKKKKRTRKKKIGILTMTEKGQYDTRLT